MIRAISRLALAAVMATLGVAGLADAQDTLSGTYNGIKDAEGATIEIAPDEEGFAGTFRDPSGASQPFEADAMGNVAQFVLDMASGTVLVQVSPMPFGAEVVMLPVGSDGVVDASRGRIDAYVRPGLSVPEPPEGFVSAPLRPGRPVAGSGFLASYEFWSPIGVRNGYLGLPEKTRTMMRFFPAVQLDVIFKLCLAPGAEKALATALRGQGVDCASVTGTMAQLQRSGRFDDYKAEVARERDQLRTSVRCGDGYPEAKSTCDSAARAVAQAAVDLRTAASVLARYR